MSQAVRPMPAILARHGLVKRPVMREHAALLRAASAERIMVDRLVRSRISEISLYIHASR